MRNAILSTLAALLLLAPAAFSATAAPTEGTWTAAEKDAARLQLTLQWETSTWGRSIARSELRGLSDGQVAAPSSTPVTFRIEREAGTFEMEGAFREGKGAGHFRFQPNRPFAATLRSLGVVGAEQVSDKDLMRLAIADVSSATLREFTRLGFGSLRVKDVMELSIHNVTPDYVRSVRALGISGTNTVSGVVEMKIHRITPEYVRDMEALGYRNLSREQLLQMSIHGVSREQVQELNRLGYRDLSARQLVELRIHRVTPAFIQEMREAGFRDLSPEALREMRIHRVSA